MKKKFLISMILFLMIGFLFSINVSNAALQVKPGVTSKQANINYWILNIRKMEETGGTLGLNDSINQTDLTSSLDTSNNLDIHMQKNTEFGAMAILSASAYGNPSPIQNGETTTGNETGIYMFNTAEWVAAGKIDLSSVYTNAHSKYKDYYTNYTYSFKPGDAITETAGWHSATSSVWIDNGYAGLLRCYNGIMFGYFGTARNIGYGHSSGGPATYSFSYRCRPVIVVGQGF